MKFCKNRVEETCTLMISPDLADTEHNEFIEYRNPRNFARFGSITIETV